MGLLEKLKKIKDKSDEAVGASNSDANAALDEAETEANSILLTHPGNGDSSIPRSTLQECEQNSTTVTTRAHSDAVDAQPDPAPQSVYDDTATFRDYLLPAWRTFLSD